MLFCSIKKQLFSSFLFIKNDSNQRENPMLVSSYLKRWHFSAPKDRIRFMVKAFLLIKLIITSTVPFLSQDLPIQIRVCCYWAKSAGFSAPIRNVKFRCINIIFTDCTMYTFHLLFIMFGNFSIFLSIKYMGKICLSYFSFNDIILDIWKKIRK